MKLLPAALLTLLSAASSILPSAAAEKESASGTRKLSAKFDKTVDKSGSLRDPTDDFFRNVMLEEIAQGIFVEFDKDRDGSWSDEEQTLAMFVLPSGFSDAFAAAEAPPEVGELDTFFLLFAATLVFFQNVSNNDLEKAMNGALSGLVGGTVVITGAGYLGHNHH